MPETQDKGGASEAIEKGAQTAHAVRSAVKTGKAIAGAAKGAAVGGPYGAVAMGLWENRKTVIKIILAAAFIMLLPVLFILMLPSLIFGGLGGSGSSGVPIMNDNAAIMTNISSADTSIQTAIQSSYDKVMADIQADIKNLDAGTGHQIVNPYEGQLLYDSSLVISQYCASKDDYKTIDLADFQSKVDEGKDHLFSFSKEIKTATVTDKDGLETTTKTAVYTVQYAGESYFADKIFNLNEEQKTNAEEYAENLNLFLDDGGTDSTNDSDMISSHPYTWTAEGFHSPFEGMDWKSHITSPFGYRLDPFTGQPSGHTGIDIGMPCGTPIKAAKDGVVITAMKQDTGYGYHIIINHGNGYETLYGHCSELLVNVGDTVSTGEVIAKVGTTGRSTGYHLHFEIIKDGQPQDPLNYIS